MQDAPNNSERPASANIPIHGKHHQHHGPDMLPTPPNSISPSLPPAIGKPAHVHPGGALRPFGPASPPEAVDSDIDLAGSDGQSRSPMDPSRTRSSGIGLGVEYLRGLGPDRAFGGLAPEHSSTYGGPPIAVPSFVGTGVFPANPVTPQALARRYLPEILLQHGPLAIRHLTAHLSSRCPGFSSIPPAKARRLVVGALEGRLGVSSPCEPGGVGSSLPIGAGGIGVGGVNGEVIFEKVGWGRWDARIEGTPPPNAQYLNASPDQTFLPSISTMVTEAVSTPPNSTTAGGRRYSTASSNASNGTNGVPASWSNEAGIFHQELAAPSPSNSATYSHEGEDDMDVDPVAPLPVAARYARNPLVHPQGKRAGSATPSISEGEELDSDATDYEDWQSIGAKDLRLGRSPASGSGVFGSWNGFGKQMKARKRRSTSSGAGIQKHNQHCTNNNISSPKFTASSVHMAEKEAVEALVRLSNF